MKRNNIGSQTTTGDKHPLRGIRRVLAEPRKYVRAWYFATLLLGVVTLGITPVLLPVLVNQQSHSLSLVAYVMGVYNVGLLTSPFWGMWAEKSKQYRNIFVSGFLLVVVSVAVFPILHTHIGWLLAAFVMGAGSSASTSLSSLLIVDFEKSDEWEPRLGMLQSFTGAGQVVGLLLAGFFTGKSSWEGLWAAAAILLPALFFAHIGLPKASFSSSNSYKSLFAHLRLDLKELAAFPRTNFLSDVSFHFHRINLNGLKNLSSISGTLFGRFLLSWFLMLLGVAGFFTYFPLMLSKSFGLTTQYSSVIYAIMASIGIVLFILASKWSVRFGAGKVYRIALFVRLGGFVLLLLPFLMQGLDRLYTGTIGFSVIVLAWPVLSVTGTNLAARLAPFSEGEAIGLFNAANASATVLGAFASGPLISRFGYSSIAIFALVCIALSILIGWGLKTQHLPSAKT